MTSRRPISRRLLDRYEADLADDARRVYRVEEIETVRREYLVVAVNPGRAEEHVRDGRALSLVSSFAESRRWLCLGRARRAA